MNVQTNNAVPASREAEYYDRMADGTVTCRLCPHECRIREGGHGRCRSRLLLCSGFFRPPSSPGSPLYWQKIIFCIPLPALQSWHKTYSGMNQDEPPAGHETSPERQRGWHPEKPAKKHGFHKGVLLEPFRKPNYLSKTNEQTKSYRLGPDVLGPAGILVLANLQDGKAKGGQHHLPVPKQGVRGIRHGEHGSFPSRPNG